MINALLKDNFSSMYEKDVALKQGIKPRKAYIL